MDGAIQNHQAILEVTHATVAELKRRALASPRKRFRLCMHQSAEERTHEMLIVFHEDAFMPPHRHPVGKSESYHVVEGSMTVFMFDDLGNVLRAIDMGPAGGDKTFLYRLSSNLWHMPVATSPWLVYHETYSGPFDKNVDVEFPSWAPQEHDTDHVERFLTSCRLARGRLNSAT